MKCFERVVLAQIQSRIPKTLDPLQYTYRPNRSTLDTISAALHIALSHLENKDAYIRMLFTDYSSAFNTVILNSLTTCKPWTQLHTLWLAVRFPHWQNCKHNIKQPCDKHWYPDRMCSQHLSILTSCITVWYGSTTAITTYSNYPLCRTSTTAESREEPAPLWRTPHTPNTDCSHLCTLVEGTEVWNAGRPDWGTAFIQLLSDC